MATDSLVSNSDLTYTTQIPYGIGLDVLRAVIDTWPGPSTRPVVIVTESLADSPESTVGSAQPTRLWATVRCEQSADLFLLGRRFERTLHKQVFEEQSSVPERP